MSGAGLRCCRICGHRLNSWSDRDEWRLLEWEDHCPGCDLYHHEYHYGHEEEVIGVIVTRWDYDQDGPANWREQEAEAKQLWASETAMGLVRAMRADPGAETPRKVLADWCDDNGLPLSAAHLRGGHE